MACTDQISTQDLENAKLDAIFQSEISNSREGGVSTGDPITTATNRFGETSDTVQGKLDKLGVIYSDPIKDWTASTLVSQLEAYRYPATTGDVYIPVAPLPFTTDATFNTDNWVLYNGVDTDQVLAIVSGDGYTPIKTLAEAVADTNAIENSYVTISDRGYGKFQYKTSQIPTGNGIIACTGVPTLSLVVINNKYVNCAHYGLTGDIGEAWNEAGVDANTLGYPLSVPAGNYTSSITLNWDGIFFAVIGAGVDLTKITFTADVIGINMKGSRLSGIQIIGIGALATQVGIVIEQNQRHDLYDVRVDGFYDGYQFDAGNLSSLDRVFAVDNVNHGFVPTTNSIDNNSITVGMMDLKNNGGEGLHFEEGTAPNVAQQWSGGIISCQGNAGKGCNISGRGHDLAIYEENNGASSTLDASSEGCQVRMVFGGIVDSGTNNDVILHRIGSVEAVQHQFLQALVQEINNRDYSGTMEIKQTGTRNFQVNMEGSTSSFNLVFRNALASSQLNLIVDGSISADGVAGGSYNSATLLDATTDINTINKSAGKMVWASSVNRPVWSQGSAAVSLWVYSDGSTAYTPV